MFANKKPSKHIQATHWQCPGHKRLGVYWVRHLSFEAIQKSWFWTGMVSNTRWLLGEAIPRMTFLIFRWSKMLRSKIPCHLIWSSMVKLLSHLGVVKFNFRNRQKCEALFFFPSHLKGSIKTSGMYRSWVSSTHPKSNFVHPGFCWVEVVPPDPGLWLFWPADRDTRCWSCCLYGKLVELKLGAKACELTEPKLEKVLANVLVNHHTNTILLRYVEIFWDLNQIRKQKMCRSCIFGVTCQICGVPSDTRDFFIGYASDAQFLSNEIPSIIVRLMKSNSTKGWCFANLKRSQKALLKLQIHGW